MENMQKLQIICMADVSNLLNHCAIMCVDRHLCGLCVKCEGLKAIQHCCLDLLLTCSLIRSLLAFIA